MKKNILLLALALGLGFLVYKTLGSSSRDTFAESEHSQFAYEDTAKLTKIFIADRSRQSALLERKNGTWYYTNTLSQKTYPANPTTVQGLLQTIVDVRARNTIAKGKTDMVIRELAGKGKKIELYAGGDQPVRVYYVGGPTDGGDGTFMKMEKSEQVYVTYVPNWRGTLDTRYSVDERTWRDPALFRLNPQTIEWVEVHYQDPSQEALSFRIERQGQQFAVKPLSDKTKNLPQERLNQDNALTYIEDFNVLGAEVILKDDNQLYDSIQRLPLFAKISYKTKDMDKAETFKLYPVINPTADRGDGDVGTRQKIQRYIADYDRERFFLLQHLVTRKILWSYDFFFKDEKVVLKEEVGTFDAPSDQQ
jgi:hypothetical protein